MRIVHVNPDRGVAPGSPKGAAVHVSAVRTALARIGVDVLAVDEHDPARLAQRLAREHEARPLSLVYERYALGAHAAGEFAALAGLPHVLEVNAPLADEEARHRPASGVQNDVARERRMLQAAELVLCVSSEVRDYAVARGAQPDRAVVQENAVDPDLFRPRRADDDVRAAIVPRGRVAIGFHGRLRPWHGFERIVAACERLVAADAPVHLVVLGEGPYAEALSGRIAPERATILGWRPHDEAARVVAAFDVLPLAYPPDAPCYFSPLKLLEAMACAAVPVVPRLGDLPRAVEHDVEGLVYEPSTVDALHAALARLVADDALRARLGRGARARAERSTWIGVARRVAALVRQEAAS